MHEFVRQFRSHAHNHRAHYISTCDHTDPERPYDSSNDKPHADSNGHGNAGIRSDPPPVVREYPTFTSDMPWAAYDFVFLSDGSVVYTFGVPIKIGSNIKIGSQVKMSGTWEKIGDNKYRVAIPGSAAGSQILREYTRVPASIDKDTGESINEHIVSQYEIDSLPTARKKLTNEMYYPERADS